MTGLLLILAVFPLIGAVGIFSFWKRQPTPPLPPAPPPTPAIEERRQSNRRGVTPVIVQVRSAPGSEEKFEGLVLDVSKGGLGQSLKQPVEAGTVVEIRPATAAPSVPKVRALFG